MKRKYAHAPEPEAPKKNGKRKDGVADREFCCILRWLFWRL